MSKEVSPSLKNFALQIALQLLDDEKDAISVLQYVREIVERRTGRAKVMAAKARRITAKIAKLPDLNRP